MKALKPVGKWNTTIKGTTGVGRLGGNADHHDLASAVRRVLTADGLVPEDWCVSVTGPGDDEMVIGVRLTAPHLSPPAGFTPLYGLVTAHSGRERLRFFCGLTEDATGRAFVGARLLGPRKDPFTFDLDGEVSRAAGWWQDQYRGRVLDAFHALAAWRPTELEAFSLFLDAAKLRAVDSRKGPVYPRKAVTRATEDWAALPADRRTGLEACLMASPPAGLGSMVALWDRCFTFAALASTRTPAAAETF